MPESQAGVQTQNSSQITQKQKSMLIVGSEQDFPPFATGMTDATAGGFTVDLWKAVATEADLNYQIRVLPFYQLLDEFKAGKIDVLINLAQSEQRKSFADFTVPHVVVHGAIFVRTGEDNIHSESDLLGKSIIVLNADLAHDYAVAQGWGKQLALVSTVEEGLRLLSAGKHDAMLLSKLAGMQILKSTGLANVYPIKARAGFSQKFSFAVQKGQSDLLSKINEGLALTKSNQAYNSIYEEWFGVYEIKEVGLGDFIKYIIPISFMFMGLLGYSYYRRLAERSLAVKALQESESRLRYMLETSPIAVRIAKTSGREVVFSNRRYNELIGVDACRGVDPMSSYANPQDYENILSQLEQGESISDRLIELTVPGYGTKWTMASYLSITYEGEAAVLGWFYDITAHKQVEFELKVVATAFETQEGILITDADGIILRVNSAFSKITGYSAEEAIGQTPRLLKSGRQDKQFYDAMWKAINSKGAWEGEIWNRRKNSEIYPEHLTITAVKDAAGIVSNYVATLTDITNNKAASERIKNLAFYDPLTQLPNRRLLVDRLQQALATSTRTKQLGALLFLDLDHFKDLNDSLGHDVGDLLLQQVAERLKGCVREGDSVARFGGDEFVVLLEGLSAQKIDAATQTEVIAHKILLALNVPYQLGTHEYYNSPSIGATLFSDHEMELDELLKQADIAMYDAKNAGRNTVRFFDQTMQEAINLRTDMERDLRNALARKEFLLHYQVQADDQGNFLGAEALIRWQHSERGLISPFDFIPLAEETGLILPVGLWVLDAACAQLKAWEQDPVMRTLDISINVSARQFSQQDFVKQVQATILRHAINPKLLKLELTESMLIDNLYNIIINMVALQVLGVRFELDDFGTGYSSLQYLKQLPLYQLKIDKSFVRDIESDDSDRSLIKAIINMAASLELQVIAEGVENEAQRQFLLDNGCTRYQGYLFGKPMPVNELEAFFKAS